jgi:hypothetical protein
MTTGIAIVGASVIAVAPIAVPPPDMSTVEVAAVDTARTVSADVELTALLDALIAAVPQAAEVTAQFFLQNLPAGVTAALAEGRFARVLTIAAVVPAAALTVPLAPFITAFANELPLPLGTLDGVIRHGFLFANAVPSIFIDVLSLAADVVDGVLSPADFPDAALGAITTRVSMAIESFQKIVAAIGGTLPLNGFQLQTLAVEDESPDVPFEPETTEFSSQSVSSASLSSPADTVTVTVDPQALGDPEHNEDGTPAGSPTEDDQSSDESQAEDNETANGGTDLTGGNRAEPGINGEQESAVEDAGSGAGTTDDTTAETAAADDTGGETTDSDAGSADSGGADE